MYDPYLHGCHSVTKAGQFALARLFVMNVHARLCAFVSSCDCKGKGQVAEQRHEHTGHDVRASSTPHGHREEASPLVSRQEQQSMMRCGIVGATIGNQKPAFGSP